MHTPDGKAALLVDGRFPVASRALQDESPKPYSFSYDINDGSNNLMARQEQQDASGRVVGFYTYVDASGLSRLVHYTADDEGFKVHIRTNEPGTATSAPASAIIESIAPRTASQVV